MDYEETSYLNLKAMEIILHAGDGRLHVTEALDCINQFNFTEAKNKLEQAFTEIRLAHEVQTHVLQKVASKEVEEEYSILFSHAQDTLMTIYSEYNLAKKMSVILETVDQRIRQLEQGNV